MALASTKDHTQFNIPWYTLNGDWAVHKITELRSVVILTWLFPNPWQWDIPMRLGGPWPNVSIQFWEATLRNYQEKGQTINYLRQITIAVITHTLIYAYKSWGILPHSVPAKWGQCYASNLKENTHNASSSHRQPTKHAAVERVIK